MKHATVSAPGKLFLSGEYAVLEGGSAVVTAVNRRATAIISRHTISSSPVLKSVTKHVAEEFGIDQINLPAVAVNTDKFSQDRVKIGLGSSAAVATSACALLFEWFGLPIADNKDRILKMALKAHTSSQSGKGSGADVAASTLGGTIIFHMDLKPEPIINIAGKLAVIWTGKSASTTNLLDQINQYKEGNASSYRSIMDKMVKKSSLLSQAYRACDIVPIIELTKEYYASMLELQAGSGAPIITTEHALISKLATEHGGAAKPSGAGGGDTAIALFKSDDDMEGFLISCAQRNLKQLHISFHADGIQT